MEQPEIPKISIVMAFFNRLDQCLFTLESIEKSSRKNQVEVIIVDDASTMSEKIIQKHHIEKYSFPVRVYAIPKKLKNWINPVVPFNYGIQKIRSKDWVILQNPECCHVGDICDYILTKCKPEEYHTFTTFAMGSTKENNILKKEYNTHDDVNKIRSYLENKLRGKWYNHFVHRNASLHFCSAIHSEKLKKIGGFNNNMCQGFWYDDNEILARIKRVTTKTNIWKIEDIGCFSIHQWHERFLTSNVKEFNRLRNKNNSIYGKTLIKKDFIYSSPEYVHLTENENEIAYITNA
jgi:glycosyltransferase involved in cell wall biosynthesis